MSENTAPKQQDHITILRSLITPDALAALLNLTDKEIAAQFAIVSEEYGVRESFIRASWRVLAQRISQATSRRNSQTRRQ